MSDITNLFDPQESAYVEMTHLMNEVYERYGLNPNQFYVNLRRYITELEYEMRADVEEE